MLFYNGVKMDNTRKKNTHNGTKNIDIATREIEYQKKVGKAYCQNQFVKRSKNGQLIYLYA